MCIIIFIKKLCDERANCSIILLLIHAIRVCYLAGEFARMLIKKFREEQGTCAEEQSAEERRQSIEEQQKIDNINILCIEIAGLCHDLGTNLM